MVYLGKFKSMINSLKQKTKLNTITQGKMALETIYAKFFFAIDGFLTGKPEKAHRLAWKYWLVPSIDTTFNLEAKERAKRIGKENPVSKKSLEFINNELKPYFEKSFVEQTKKTLDNIEKVSLLKVKENISKFEKEKKGIFH